MLGLYAPRKAQPYGEYIPESLLQFVFVRHNKFVLNWGKKVGSAKFVGVCGFAHYVAISTKLLLIQCLLGQLTDLLLQLQQTHVLLPHLLLRQQKWMCVSSSFRVQ